MSQQLKNSNQIENSNLSLENLQSSQKFDKKIKLSVQKQNIGDYNQIQSKNMNQVQNQEKNTYFIENQENIIKKDDDNNFNDSLQCDEEFSEEIAYYNLEIKNGQINRDNFKQEKELSQKYKYQGKNQQNQQLLNLQELQNVNNSQKKGNTARYLDGELSSSRQENESIGQMGQIRKICINQKGNYFQDNDVQLYELDCENEDFDQNDEQQNQNQNQQKQNNLSQQGNQIDEKEAIYVEKKNNNIQKLSLKQNYFMGNDQNKKSENNSQKSNNNIYFSKGVVLFTKDFPNDENSYKNIQSQININTNSTNKTAQSTNKYYQQNQSKNVNSITQNRITLTTQQQLDSHQNLYTTNSTLTNNLLTNQNNININFNNNNQNIQNNNNNQVQQQSRNSSANVSFLNNTYNFNSKDFDNQKKLIFGDCGCNKVLLINNDFQEADNMCNILKIKYEIQCESANSLDEAEKKIEQKIRVGVQYSNIFNETEIIMQ
ncbi:hypothetical protein PPERSA_09013 [Pseudocohnilembus persalinus]|uniref:Uncharacterized protein n=1 Tax=Pseudocohnilembus persalinus TaxID=266149 RepID=A0A0V0R390_PSEPJ|nr:hypothetical protein PPERSA_09013 [Pseudocohnilembus persalinus]|eukprot:KRX08909.1 hypothetical protein PPERSA_09013 [Pseudocohnilembus persalinus]